MSEKGDRVGDRLPLCDTSDPAQLEAWYGNFGHGEHYRKVVLANAREIERAKAIMLDIKVSESRLDDLARTNPLYLDYLALSLKGRQLREQNVKDSYATR